MALRQPKARPTMLPSTPGYSVVEGERVLFSDEDLLAILPRLREHPGRAELYRHSDGKLIAYTGNSRHREEKGEDE